LKRKKKKLEVSFENHDTKTQHKELFDTVLFAMGREGQTHDIGLEKIGVKMKDGKIITNDNEQSNIDNIFAVGDCAVNRPELTPVAIMAGELLAKRLFAGHKVNMNYSLIPTTVFTPFEYGTVGLSEEDAIAKLGKENVEVYLSRFGALEVISSHVTLHKPVRSYCFHDKTELQEGDEANTDAEELLLNMPNLSKLVVDKRNNEKVIGFHYVGANAGEITQGFAVAVKVGATKADFDSVVGIHPTGAEEFVTLSVTRSSGETFTKKAGCGGGKCG